MTKTHYSPVLATTTTTMSATPRQRPPKSTADEARSITTSLRRTQALLQHELERVSHVTDAIDQDGQVLSQTKSHQRAMKDTVKGAKAALRNLQLQQRKEMLVLTASVAFFYAVVLYVVWTRIRIPFLLW
jgi:uncharacterized protein YaaR (DUF327 family)